MDDDGADIGATYVRILAQPGKRAVVVQRDESFQPGDTIAIVDWKNESERGRAVVVQAKPQKDRSCVLMLDSDVQTERTGPGDGKPWGDSARRDGIDRIIDYSNACQSILIEGNTFEGCGAHGTVHHYAPGCAIHIARADGVRIRNNAFDPATATAPPGRPEVIIERSRNVLLESNRGLAEKAVRRDAN